MSSSTFIKGAARLLARLARYQPVQNGLHQLASAYKQQQTLSAASPGHEIAEILPIDPRPAPANGVARLNLLRTVIREAEVAGAQAFIDKDFSVSRGDVLQALNRLSSAVYVLMLISWTHEKSGRQP